MNESNEPVWNKIGMFFTIGLSIAALAISCCSYMYVTSPGEVQPHKPSGYGFIRGIHPFPSDHIVLPIEWENTGGRAVTVRHSYLVLRELGPDDNETETEYCFLLAGEYPDISTNSFDEFYSIKDSLILDPHSITHKNLVFHIKDLWNESNNATHRFEFTSGVNYSVYFGYKKNLVWQQPVDKWFDKMEIYGAVDDLKSDRSEGHYWEYFYDNPGAGKLYH